MPLLTLPSTIKNTKKPGRKGTRWGLIAGNCLLLLTVGIFVIANRSASQTVRSSTVNSPTATVGSVSNPLDQLSSAQIARQAAELTNIPERTAVRNQADSEAALLAVVPNDPTIVAKPQIVSTTLKSKFDIIHYVVQNGDSIDSLAAKFKLTTGSITGSNSLNTTALKPGTTILIPPANGIVYQVKSGDTIAKIINKFGADRDLTILVNDAESDVKSGEYIWIPNVSQPQTTGARSYVPNALGAFAPIFGYNGYDYGFCTWYVAAKIAVPSNWGNANTWDDYARRTPGWAVSLAPSTGAIGQTDAGWAGHVAIVNDVSEDGTQIKYSDMNGLAGWGRVGQSDWAPANHFPHYIIHQ